MSNRSIFRVCGTLLVLASLIGCQSSSQQASRYPAMGQATETVTSSPAPPVYTANINHSVLSRATTSNTSVVISIGSQQGYLLVDGDVAASSQVSTARTGKYTPRGTFSMTERVRSGKISNIYNVAMPFWMRLDGSPIGVHAGYIPGYPASAGCIRLPYDMAKVVYENTRSGTKVRVVDHWSR